MECLCSTILMYSYGYNESGGSLLTLGSVRYSVPSDFPAPHKAFDFERIAQGRICPASRDLLSPPSPDQGVDRSGLFTPRDFPNRAPLAPNSRAEFTSGKGEYRGQVKRLFNCSLWASLGDRVT